MSNETNKVKVGSLVEFFSDPRYRYTGTVLKMEYLGDEKGWWYKIKGNLTGIHMGCFTVTVISDPMLLKEAIADVAFFAGQKGYYTGDSRADISYYIYLAEEFEKRYSDIEWGLDLDYIETMEDFCEEMFDKEHFGKL